jgi:hypothetical protein
MAQFPCPRCGGDPPLIAPDPSCAVCHGVAYEPRDPRSAHQRIAETHPLWHWYALLAVGLTIVGKAAC